MSELSSLLKNLLLLLLLVLLTACGGGSPTEVKENPVPPPVEQPPVNYTGPAPATSDVQNFKKNVWDELSTQQRCGNCHVQGQQAPYFVRYDDINEAYSVANTLVNKSKLSDSLLVSKVAGGHNCWLTSTSACADIMQTWLAAWLDTEITANEVVLQAPPVKTIGANKNFPESPDLFGENIHPLLTSYCSDCHQPSATIPISPYIASSDVGEAYLASISKINLDNPADSRLVARLRNEFHNCWSDSCAADANALQIAIQAMSDGIEVTTLDSNIVASNAVSMFDGTLASGGGRFESNVIAKWEFKTGSGNQAFDTSGVSPALDLTLSGSYDWVGGWGVRLTGGKAQGSTAASKKLYDNILSTGEFSIEAWIAPGNVTQEGPARIFTYSGGDDSRNFMLGQTLYNYDFLVRHDNTDTNGMPALSTANADEVLQAALQHVVINYTSSGGRRIFVNGEDTGYVDSVEGGLLNQWDDSFAFAIGSEVSGRHSFDGTVRMVVVYNRVLTPEQISSNFEAGIGQKFYLLFGISEIVNVPQAYVGFEVSQFDTYSYLFTEPFVVSLDPQANIDGIDLSGVRIGINGREEDTGQVFATLDTTVDVSNSQPVIGVPISRQGTIIPVQKGPALDEFFLSFERLGDAVSIRALPPIPVPAEPVDIEAQSEIGMRDFAEINASMSALTGVAASRNEVVETYNTLRQQLPSVSSMGSFVASNQMAITQMAIKYCDTLVEDTALRSDFFPSLDVQQDINNGVDASLRQALIDPLYTRLLNAGDPSQPASTEVSTELNALIDRLSTCSNTNSCSSDATRTLAKATCAAVLGSAVVVVQ